MNILPSALSDHDFVQLGISLDGSSKRAGVWKFNNSLLTDPDFKSFLSKIIIDFKVRIPDFGSLRAWWDSLKVNIHDVCIRFSICKHRFVNNERTSIAKHLIKAKLDLHSGRPIVPSVISDLEGQLSSLISKQSKGAKIRSRAQWFEEGEKPTRYFSALNRNALNLTTLLAF